MRYKIVDNFLNPKTHESIFEYISSGSLMWTSGPVMDYTQVGRDRFKWLPDEVYNFRFAHSIYKDARPQTEMFDRFLLPFITVMNGENEQDSNPQNKKSVPELRSLIRAKINFNPRSDKIVEHCYHVDNPYGKEAKNGIYYLNTNNGYTILKVGGKEVKVESIANRFLIFDGDIFHTGTTCTDQVGRYVLNLNFF